jgi:Family of unknown function (DUF6311)
MLDANANMKRLFMHLRARAPELCAVSLAVAWFFYLGYGPTLNPSFVAWLWRDDWSAYQWGFSFFRNATWSWPLGSVPNLFYPHGTSVGFTDANPWLCVLFKPLSPLLPRDFQVWGVWYLLCYALQAWFGTQICRTLTRDPVQCALGGALFALTPLLPIRARHIALCAQFFVTFGLWLNLRREHSPEQVRHGLLLSIALLIWAAGTHAYLALMLLVLCLTYYARLHFVDRLLGTRAWLEATLGALAATLSVFYAFGFIGWKRSDLSVPGFGQYSADLLALFNAQGLSRFVPALPFHPWQWEGYAYLGLGVFFLLSIALLRALAAPAATLRGLAPHWPLLSAVFFMSVYALSSKVTYRGELVLDLSPLYAPIGTLAGIFRSSGRFVWPLDFLLIAWGVRAVASRRYRHFSRAALALALVLSAAEQDPQQLSFDAVPLLTLRHEAWQSTSVDYAHLELVPLQLQWECRYNPALVDALSYEAYRRRLTFNSGNFMRKEPNVRALCGKDPSVLDARTVYVVEPARVASMRQLGATCGRLDGLYVCVSEARATHLLVALRSAAIP